MMVQIRLPVNGPPPGMQSATNLSRPPEQTVNSSSSDNNSNVPRQQQQTIRQMFEVTVPLGVLPNQPFSLMAAGQRVLVNCPSNARRKCQILYVNPFIYNFNITYY